MKHSLIDFVQKQFSDHADTIKADKMASYMRTKQPFYGVYATQRKDVLKQAKTRYKNLSTSEWVELAKQLWALPHREEQYFAIEWLASRKECVSLEYLELYESWIREGAWWDLVDAVIGNFINPLVIWHRDEMLPWLEKWIQDSNFWLRRVAILSQNKSKQKTHAPLLFSFCLQQAHEKEFFIQKAIGWALREYAKSNPTLVFEFVEKEKKTLPALSVREALKHFNP